MEPDTQFWRDKRVCVTGGTGLLGYQIVKCLLALRARVRILSLEPPDYHPVRHCDEIDWSLGDIRDRSHCERSLSDADVVFHTAGVVSVWGPSLSRMREVHVRGMKNAIAATPKSARLIHTSSIVAVGASRSPTPLVEDDPFLLDQLQVAYVQAKREAEQIAQESAASGRDIVITNPGYLVGPEDFERSVMGRFCHRFWRGQLPLAPPGGFNLVDVRDVAVGHLLAAERGRSGRRYILGGENRNFQEFMALLANVGGLRPRTIPTVPWWTLAATASLAEVRSRMTRRAPYPSLQLARMNRYYWYYRSDRAARELGFQARSLGQSLTETFQWCSSVSRFKVRGLSRFWMRPAKTNETPARGPHRPREQRSTAHYRGLGETEAGTNEGASNP
jgi:dihydroflavonol-4-reductase